MLNLKIKAQFDDLRHEPSEEIMRKIVDYIWENTKAYGDSIVEFNLIISNLNDITKEVGLDEDGCVNQTNIEITKIPETTYEWICYDCGKIEESTTPLGGYIICGDCAKNEEEDYKPRGDV